ncbi:MAG TPA: HDOD domain-containing protein, partial [Terriglobia bacterium]|nr:HDOD domain-containing protein [Terriglobia bacterium]
MMIVRNEEPFLHQDEAARLRKQLQALQDEANLFNPPPSLDQINRLLSSAPVDLRRLGEAIRDHSGLVTEALKLCNSTLFSLPQPVSNLEQAVIITDADVVRTLLLACWIIQCAGQK